MEQMDLINDGASIITEEDRISNLPDDVTYHILSFMDMKDAIQTSTLSRKWKHIWTLMPRFNLDSDAFFSLHRFGNFVVHALSHRNNLAEVSAVKLNFRGSTTQLFVKDILNYASLRNLRQLTMTWTSVNPQELPRCLFRSHTLKHITLINKAFSCRNSCTPNSAWDFPALETLNMTCLRLGDGFEKNLNLFTKCVNLTDITLHRCSMKGLEIFNVCTPQLSKFTITESSVLPKVFNVVAPQLQTLTASTSVQSSTDGLASCSNFLHLSTPGFNALEKVNLTLSNSRFRKKRHVPSLLELFRILRNVKFLILDMDIIESLSSCLDQLSHEPCPFDNLKCLKIDMTQLKQRDRIATIPTQVRNYLLENSPNATFIMDLPQVSQKRSRQQVHSDTVTKVAKSEVVEKLPGTMTEPMRMLEAEIHRQNRVIAEQKEEMPARFQVNGQQMAKIRMQDQIIAHQKEKIQAQFQVNKYQTAKIQMQDQVIAQQKEKTQRRDQFIAKQKKVFRAKIQKQDQLVAKQRTMFEAKMQMQHQDIAKLKDMLAAQNLQHEKLMSQIIKCKMAQLKVQVESGNPDYGIIGSMGRDINLAMDLIPRNLRVNVDAEFSSQYEAFKCVYLNRIDASKWARIETELGNIRHSDWFTSSHSHSQLHVHALEHSAAPRPFPANMTASSGDGLAGSNMVVQPSQSPRIWF